MVSYNIPVTGEAMVQTDLPYSNIIFNDLEGVLYNPQVDGKVIAEFNKTLNPSLGKNFAWDNVNLNWTRDAPATPMDGFKTTVTLNGILPNGEIDIIGEYITTTIPSTEVTEDILFNLRLSRAMASLSKSNIVTATSGKVQVNLPKRYLYYDSITLERYIPTGWDRMVAITFEGASTELVPGQLKKILIPYDADMNTDFSDLRFLNTDGRSFLCHNIDSKVDSSYAIVTVQVPVIPITPSMKTIYMIYGNSSASAISSSFTSAALTSDEPDPYQVEVAVDDFNDASIDSSIWTVSDPTSGTDVTESSGTLNVIVDSGITTSNFSTVPIVYTPLDNGDWQFKIRFTNSSLNGDVEGGIFLMNTRSNVKEFKFWRNGTDSKYYFQDPTGTNTEVAGGAYWMRITYRGGTYYFDYSAGGTAWTTLYTTSSLGITPTDIGMYAHHWGANQPVTFTFDDFSLMKVLGPESDLSDTSIDPDTATEEDTELLFTLTADWIPGCTSFLKVTEARSTVEDTPDLEVSDEDVLDLGYNSVDRYAAMQLNIVVEADNTCNVRYNSIEYGVEV